MKKCTKSTTGKHEFELAQINLERKNQRSRKTGFFIFEDEHIEQDLVRTFLPQCVFCEMFDNSKKPNVEVEHDEYKMSDMSFD